MIVVRRKGRYLEYGNWLSTITQVAVALTGFTGVVAVLGHRDHGAWTPEERLQLRTLVETSLTALFASLAPIVIFIALGSEPVAWRGANAVIGVLHLLNLSAFLWRAKRARPTASQRVLLVIGVAAIVAHFLAAAGVLPWFALIFFLGLIQQVFISALNFILLLFPLDESSV
jgi:hypothetical protein